jgi:hypothetical protein
MFLGFATETSLGNLNDIRRRSAAFLLDALRIRQKRSFRKCSLPVVRVARKILVHRPTSYDRLRRIAGIHAALPDQSFLGRVALPE